MLSGPLGGNPGAAPRAGKGQSKRRMHLKGLRMGSYVIVSYREKRPGHLDEKVDYEGTLVDKRVGWENRESYVELKDCIQLNDRGEIVAREERKRLIDAFIEDCDIVDRRERPLSAELAQQEGSAGGVQDGFTEGATAGSMMPMGMGMMPMAMPGMMPMGMGGMPMGMMPMGMGGMPMGMMPMGMGGMPMGMMPMAMACMMAQAAQQQQQPVAAAGTSPAAAGACPQGPTTAGGTQPGGCMGMHCAMAGGMQPMMGVVPMLQPLMAGGCLPGLQPPSADPGRRERSRSRG